MSLTAPDIRGIYYARIHPGRINIYYEPFVRKRNSVLPVMDPNGNVVTKKIVPDNLKDNHRKQELSVQTIKKIKRAVDYLTFLVPKKRYFNHPDGRRSKYFLTFITLTLSSTQIHSDNEIKSVILQPFLDRLRKRRRVNNYIWRAEKQTNGNIHFHILADRAVWWNDIRNDWNEFQERLGYVSHYRNAMQEWHGDSFKPRPELFKTWSLKNQYKAYKKGIKCDWTNPNSTDIHGLQCIGNVRAYISKYITKREGGTEIQGRNWGCSYSLSKLEGSLELAEGEIAPILEKLELQKGSFIVKKDYFYIIYYDVELLRESWMSFILLSLMSFCMERFPMYRPPPDLFQ